LKVDGVTRDRTENEIRAREECQCAAARFMAACQLHGTGKKVNRMAENKI